MSETRNQQRMRRLAERSAKIQEEMQRLRQQEKTEHRRQSARREQLVGAAMLELVERGQWPRERLMEVLDKRLSNPKDRRLFGLPVDDPAQAPAAPAPATP